MKSPTLQALALRLTLLCAKLEITPLFLHAPGTDLVEEGIDDASRRLCAAISGPACSPSLRDLVLRISAGQGWAISVDIFASECNSLVDRYFSEFAEPRAEAVDALSVTYWHCSFCPGCGRAHREVLFAFPPSILIRRLVTKARADGARGITASYWPRLVSASLPINGEAYLRLASPSRARPSQLLLLHSGATLCRRLRARQPRMALPSVIGEVFLLGRPPDIAWAVFFPCHPRC